MCTAGVAIVHGSELKGCKRCCFKHSNLCVLQGKFKPAVARVARTIREFDDAITIHSFGWESTDQYYASSSSAKAVPQVFVCVFVCVCLCVCSVCTCVCNFMRNTAYTFEIQSIM